MLATGRCARFACFTSTKVQILTRLRQLLLRPLSSGGRTCSASVLRDPHAFIHQAVQDAVRASASVAASQLPAVSSY
jgi:hypothetical protein